MEAEDAVGIRCGATPSEERLRGVVIIESPVITANYDL
jgi:hypothetical protein